MQDIKEAQIINTSAINQTIVDDQLTNFEFQGLQGLSRIDNTIELEDQLEERKHLDKESKSKVKSVKIENVIFRPKSAFQSLMTKQTTLIEVSLHDAGIVEQECLELARAP